VRQIIGWREYNYFIYYFFRDYLETNHFYTNNKRNIPDNIWNRNTNIIYIDDILNKVHNYAYSHHIERLMGIGNFLNLIGVKPEEIYKWFSTMYIDAYDVFMIPNVYGMLLYGYVSNNKHMMTKPYLCASNYIIKMSNYKKDDWNEIINALYYEFINLYKAKFKKIYSLAMMVKNYENKDSKELKQMKQIKNKYLTSLY
jgi:deoxyribodipyrimidine photolyase-related protein